MVTKILSTSVFVAASYLAHASLSNFPELKTYLSEHQDSMKAHRQFQFFALYQRSYQFDPGFDTDGDCIYGRNFECYPEESYCMGFVLHRRPSANKQINRTLYLITETTEGYEKANAYTPSQISVKTLPLQYIFLAAEYDNCDIVRVPHMSNGCEVWVQLDKINEVSSLCLFIYDLLCGPEKYITYDPEACRNVTVT
ncbi:uncharacterized protein LOC119178498 isoform X1 [Rhipicephalus microplus]|uniref:uncharacterized protein LOC119178498 isoform X1 n=1 Tax=Rhipicephalus microplus TaxID=6941 RepID=UPI003F6C632F